MAQVKSTKKKTKNIKKKTSARVSKVVQRIKEDEKKITIAISLVFLCLFGIVACFLLTAISVEKIDGIKSGPLYIKFGENKDGMSDIINFTEEDFDPSLESAVIYATKFTVTNTSGLNSWYAVYLDDYQDMIDYDGCDDKQINKDDIFFSIDNSEPIMLSSVNYNGRYLITEGILDSNNDVEHTLKVWHIGYNEKHFHGKITVKYIR